jgi:hypothetical protein
MRYVTGDNAPGFLPDVEPRGPWNSWADAVRDVAALIDESCDSLVEDADDDDDAQHIEDEAGRAVEALDTDRPRTRAAATCCSWAAPTSSARLSRTRRHDREAGEALAAAVLAVDPVGALVSAHPLGRAPALTLTHH